MSAALEAQGDTFAAGAMLPEAARAYEEAARSYAEAGQADDAQRMWLRYGEVLLIVGACSEALAAVDRVAGADALMLKGTIYDALGDDRAFVAWTQALQKVTDPMQRHVCTAHLFGCLVKRGEAGANAQLRAALENASELRREDRIECVGAAGLSAGRNGTPLLAQAMYAVARHPEAWSPEMAPVWQRLIETAPAHAIDLCALGSQLTLRRKGQDHGLVMARVELVIQRVAAEHRITVDDVLAQIASRNDKLFEYDRLRALVPDDQWVLAV